MKLAGKHRIIFGALLPMLLLVANAAGQQFVPAIIRPLWIDPSRDDPAFHSIFCPFQVGEDVWTLNLHVPRSGRGTCYLEGVSASEIGVRVSAKYSTPPLTTFTPKPQRHIIYNEEDLYRAASGKCETITLKDGTIYPYGKLLTGTLNGFIVVDLQGVFAIPRSALSPGSLRTLKALSRPAD